MDVCDLGDERILWREELNEKVSEESEFEKRWTDKERKRMKVR